MKNRLSWISFFVGVGTFLLYAELWLIHYGFDLGVSAGESMRKKLSCYIEFSGGVQTTYELFGSYYFYLAAILLVFLMSKYIEIKPSQGIDHIIVFNKIVCFGSLASAIYLIWRFYVLKSEYLFFEGEYNSYTFLLYDSVWFDWIGFALIMFLLFVQLGILAIGRFKK